MGFCSLCARFLRDGWPARIWDALAICGMLVAGAAITALYMMVLCASIWTF